LYRPVAAIAFLALALHAPPASALTLAEAMEAAGSNTESAELLRLAEDAAEARSQVVLGELLPNLRVSASSVRNSQSVELGGSAFVQLWDHQASLRLSIDVFRGTSIPTWVASRTSEDATAERTRWQSAGLRLATARAYLGALTARQNVEAARQSVSLREASLEQVTVLEEAGYALAADISRARYSLIEASSTLLEAGEQVEAQLETLRFLTGLDVERGDALEAVAIPGYDGEQPTADMRALAFDIEAAERLVRAQWLSFLPVLGLAGQYTIGAESLRAPDGTSWFVSFTATWDVFDYGRYGRLAGARVDSAEADALLRQLERERRRALDGASRRVRVSAELLALADEASALAAETRRLEADRFSGGDLTILDLVSADIELFRSQINRNRFALERALAQIELAYLEGALEDDSWLSE
jgi:outer membrane protein TolC